MFNSSHRYNIQMWPIFQYTKRAYTICVHPLSCTLHHLAFRVYKTQLAYRNGPSAYICKCGVVEYLASETLTLELNLCFIFRFFYTAYEQYLHIVGDAVRNLSLSIAATFLVIFILLGFDLWSALMILVPVLMIMLSMFGVMYLWSIPLNALSVVNLVMVGTNVFVFDYKMQTQKKIKK